MKFFDIGLISLLAIFFMMLSNAKVDGAEDEALKKEIKDSQESANVWLAAVDQGKYIESWDIASLTFQLTIKKDEWAKTLEKTRQSLGAVKSREILDIRTAKDPKGLPAGDYMVYFYKTAFANKDKSFELLTLQKQNNGQWKALTYQVQ